MTTVIQLLKMAAVLMAAILLGNWYLAELRKAHSKGKPWYAAYLSLPGILIILAIMIPVIVYLFFD